MDKEKETEDQFHDFTSLLHRLRERGFWGNVTLHLQDGQLRRLNVNESIRVEDLEDRMQKSLDVAPESICRK